MNKNAFRIMTALLAVATLAATGCRSKPKNNGNESYLDGDDVAISDWVDGDTGLSLTEAPFDQTHSRAYDVAVDPIYFGYDSFQLPAEEIAKIQQAAEILRGNAGYVLIIEGHCDERGSNEYNLSLGEQRALAVRNYIVSLGIDAQRIQARSFGEERPAVQGTGEAAWRLNRRGEFAFYK